MKDDRGFGAGQIGEQVQGFRLWGDKQAGNVRHGGFYLGSIGGPAARLAQDCIKKVEVLEYPELGMEAIWRIEVEDFPAFIIVDDKGNDFFASVSKPIARTIPVGRPS